MDFNKGIASGPGQADRLLGRQGSVISLTFDEFHNTLGKDFGSMNMDELLKSIWTAEESQAMAGAFNGGSTGGGAAPLGGGIHRQGSLALPRTISQKTVDEVWRDLVRENSTSTSAAGAAAAASAAVECQPHRQQTLGEMTLEEFLVRAGVVREDAVPQGTNINTGNGNSNDPSSSGNSLFYNNLMGNGGNPIMGNSMPMPLRSYPVGGLVGLGEPVVGISNMVMGQGGVVRSVESPDGALGKVKNGDMGSLSPVAPFEIGGGMRSMKKGSGTVEKVVERRQRRMIKNRESAARSRARKQAYTMELEAEVAKLKEQNKELQEKQDEMMKLQNNQVAEMLNHQCGPKKLCLRRTQTGPW